MENIIKDDHPSNDYIKSKKIIWIQKKGDVMDCHQLSNDPMVPYLNFSKKKKNKSLNPSMFQCFKLFFLKKKIKKIKRLKL
jgi:hypothetical protein